MISQINKNLFISNSDSALNQAILRKYKISYAIDCTKNRYKLPSDIKYINFPSSDPPMGSDFI